MIGKFKLLGVIGSYSGTFVKLKAIGPALVARSWILASNVWEDSGVWKDGSTWND